MKMQEYIKLRKCPFCGSEAELNCDNVRRRDRLTNTKAEAEQWIEEQKTIGVVLRSEIHERYNERYKSLPRVRFAAFIVGIAFMPRCTNSSCIARRSVAFSTEEEACNAWNGLEAE